MKELLAPVEFDAFTCSLHPEMTQVEPGNCAKCGLKLTKVSLSQRTERNQQKLL